MAVSISLSIVQNSQNTSNITSNITVRLTASWTYGSYNRNDPSGSVTIDGTKYNFSSDFNAGESETGSEVIYTKTLNIKHDTTTGKKTLLCSASFATGVSSGTVTTSNSKVLTQLPTITISYNANGGAGAPSSQSKYYDKALTLSSTKPTRTGYKFLGWSTSSTATSATYSSGGSCALNTSDILYAVWQEYKLTVNYYSNYATSAFEGALNTVGSDKNVKVWTFEAYYSTDYSTYGLANYSNSSGSVYMTRTGYTATGNWGTSTSGGTLINENTDYASGQALAKALGKDLSNGDASVNIYAQWKINTYTIAYNSNGGSGSMKSQTVNWNETFKFSNSTFLREGYKFIGWNLYRNDDSKWYAVGQGWLTEDEILAGGYSKKVYSSENELIFDTSWIRNNEEARLFTLYAIWEISGVVYIDNGTLFEPYLAYIDNGTDWDLYIAYIDDGVKWNIIS